MILMLSVRNSQFILLVNEHFFKLIVVLINLRWYTEQWFPAFSNFCLWKQIVTIFFDKFGIVLYFQSWIKWWKPLDIISQGTNYMICKFISIKIPISLQFPECFSATLWQFLIFHKYFLLSCFILCAFMNYLVAIQKNATYMSSL